MSQPPDDWNPEDGPPPTADEREDARTLADALVSSAHTRALDPDVEAVRDVALRVRETAHPDPDHVRGAVHTAVDDAVRQAGQRKWRTRWTLVAVSAAAATALGVGGAQYAWRGDVTVHRPSISRPGSDAFDQPVGTNPGSDPIARLTDTRMRSYRDVFLRGGRRAP